jgi:hypothetical protein
MSPTETATGTVGRRRGVDSRSIAAVLVALALVVVGCGSTQQSQSTPVAAASPSVPTPTVAVSHAPTPNPTKAPGSAAIAAFVKLVGNGKLDYQATFTGRSRHSATRLPVKGAIAVSGNDYQVTAVFTFDNGKAGVDHRYVGGKAWMRFEGDAWRQMTSFKAASSMSPFASVTGVESVRFIDAEKLGGKPVYRISIVSDPLHPSLIPATNLTNETVTSGVLELLIDESGRPISGAATINGSGRVSGQLQEIIIELKLTFTKIGQNVVVRAP